MEGLKVILSFPGAETVPEKDYTICVKRGNFAMFPQVSIDGKVVEVRNWENLNSEERKIYKEYSQDPEKPLETKDSSHHPFIGCLMGSLTFFYSDNCRMFPHLQITSVSKTKETTLEGRILMAIFDFFILRMVEGGATRGRYSLPLSGKYTVSMNEGIFCISVPGTKFEYFFTKENANNENFDEGVGWLVSKTRRL